MIFKSIKIRNYMIFSDLTVIPLDKSQNHDGLSFERKPLCRMSSTEGYLFYSLSFVSNGLPNEPISIMFPSGSAI